MQGLLTLAFAVGAAVIVTFCFALAKSAARADRDADAFRDALSVPDGYTELQSDPYLQACADGCADSTSD